MRKHVLCLALLFAATPLVAQPLNDECDAGNPFLVEGTNLHDSIGATDSTLGPVFVGCGTTLAMSGDVWYQFTLDPVYTTDMLVSVSTCITGWDTDLEIYEGDCTAYTVVGCDGDSCIGSFGNFGSNALFTASPGLNYIIRVGEWSSGGTGWVGQIDIAVSSPPPPLQDECDVTTNPVLVVGTNAHDSTGATTSATPAWSGCPAGGGLSMSADVFYNYTNTNPDDVIVVVSNCIAGADTDMAVYETDCLGAEIACGGDQCGLASSVSFTALAGETYVVRVGEWGAGGTGWVGTIEVEEFMPLTNDECDVTTNPALVVGSNPHSSFGATDSTTPAWSGCPGSVGGAMSADVFYTYTNSTAGDLIVEISNCVAGFDTDLAIYETDCFGAEIACSGDAGGACGLSSSVLFTALAGQTYVVRVGEWGSGGGGWSGTIEVEEFVPGPGPTPILHLDDNSFNNTSAAALDCLGLTADVTTVASWAEFESQASIFTWETLVIESPANLITAGAVTAITDHVAAGGGAVFCYWNYDASPGLWSSFGADGLVDVFNPTVISAGAASADDLWNAPNVIAALSIPAATSSPWNDEGDELLATTGTVLGEFPSGNPAIVEDNTGLTVLIGHVPDSQGEQEARDLWANAIEGVRTAQGFPTGSGPCPRLNDECANATPIAATQTISTVGAVDEGTLSTCQVGVANDLWYSYTAGCAGDYEFSTTGSTFDTMLALYDTCGGIELDCQTLGGVATVNLAAGAQVLIQVAGQSGATGTCDLTINFLQAPANDDCSNATIVVGGTVAGVDLLDDPFNTACATADPGQPLPACGIPSVEMVWWEYQASADANIIIDTNGATGSDTILAVFTGDCATLTEIACDDDGGVGLASQVILPVVNGESYYIAVTGWNGGTANSDLTITLDLPIDASAYDVVLINGEGDAAPGLGYNLVDSRQAYVDWLTNNGLSFVEVEPNVSFVTGCPQVGWIYNNGTYPDDAAIDPVLSTAIKDCVLLGNSAWLQGGDMFGFLDPLDMGDVDGVDDVLSSDGGDACVDVAGVVGSEFDTFASAYTQDSTFSDYTDNMIADVTTDLLSTTAHAVLTSASAGYDVGIINIHDETMAPGAGDVYSSSVEPAGMDDAQAYLDLVNSYVALSGGTVGMQFKRGDANNDGATNIADAVFIAQALFVPGSDPLVCDDAADTNDDGAVNIADAVYVAQALFVPGAAPIPDPVLCGVDPTAEVVPLECGVYSHCP